MGSIETAFNFDKNLTLLTATGKITVSDIQSWMKEYYAGKVTMLILWDFKKADLSGISTEDLRDIQEENRLLVEKRTGGKTALVFSEDYAFGIGRMFESIAELSDVPFKIKSFLSMKEAEHWLGV